MPELVEPEKIPQNVRYFGTEMPYITRPVLIPKDEIAVPPHATGYTRGA